MENVIAVIVTYNRQQLLSECITALNNQTRRPDSILVVNNGSTDNTEAWLKQQENIFFITQENSGSAGGFSTGIKWAYDNGYSWIWCMDDDGYSKNDALENLLLADDGNLRLLNCSVLDHKDKNSFVWNTKNYALHSDVKKDIIEGIGHPFNGTLIHRRIVERVGVPDSKLFVWGDETEYYYRIVNKNKIPVCTITGSIHYHPATRFSIKQDWQHSSSWKMYFYVRNRYPVLQSKYNNKVVAFFCYCCFLIAFAAVILFFQKTDKVNKLKFMVWPAKDAVLKNYNITPVLIIKRLQQAQKGKTSFQKIARHSKPLHFIKQYFL